MRALGLLVAIVGLGLYAVPVLWLVEAGMRWAAG